MNMRGFLRPGIRIKRWLFIGFVGMLLLGTGFSGIFTRLGLGVDKGGTTALLIILGILAEYTAIRGFLGSGAAQKRTKGLGTGRTEGSRRIIQKRILMRGPRV